MVRGGVRKSSSRRMFSSQVQFPWWLKRTACTRGVKARDPVQASLGLVVLPRKKRSDSIARQRGNSREERREKRNEGNGGRNRGENS